MVFSALLYLLAVEIATYVSATPARITSFTQTPAGAVAPGTIITFLCEASDATSADLFVNGTDIYSHPITGFNNSNNFIRPGEWNNSLTTIASLEHNNTVIECIAHGDVGGQAAQRSLNITIADVPLPPQPMVQVLFGGHAIHVYWNPPFSHDGFPILSYSLTVTNQTGHRIASEILPDDMVAFNISTHDNAISVSCNTLQFIMTARNDIGTSAEGHTSGGFPIVPVVNELTLFHNITFIRNVIWIHINFQEPEVCDYQEPADYYLVLYQSNHVVASYGPKPAVSNTGSEYITENFTTGILVDQTYTVTLTISHCNLPGQATFDLRIATTVSSSSENSTEPIKSESSELLIIIIASLGTALFMCVLLIIGISVACIFAAHNKGRRSIMSDHIDIPLQSIPTTPEFKLAPPPKGKKVPTSLTPKVVNPIYDGVTYDSPGGESFRALLGGNCSVPSTPLGPCTPLGHCTPLGSCTPMPPSTPLGEVNSRYFDMPPSLPPPRRASVGMRPPGIPEEDVDTTCTGKSDYGEIVRQRSASCLAQRPSSMLPALVPHPLNIPPATSPLVPHPPNIVAPPTSCLVQRPPNIPPALYEAMGGGECGGDYEVIRK